MTEIDKRQAIDQLFRVAGYARIAHHISGRIRIKFSLAAKKGLADLEFEPLTEQLQGAAEQQQPGPRVQPQAQGQPAVDPVMRQMQAMLHQLAADQQAMWQQMQAMHTMHTMHAPGYDQPQYSAPRQQGAPPQAEACEHHTVDPRQQAEHFMRMAEKFSRGDLSMADVAGGLSYLNTQSSSFWKGLLIGGGLTKRMIDGFPSWI
jgi:Cu/Zn superoxide dismutase